MLKIITTFQVFALTFFSCVALAQHDDAEQIKRLSQWVRDGGVEQSLNRGAEVLGYGLQLSGNGKVGEAQKCSQDTIKLMNRGILLFPKDLRLHSLAIYPLRNLKAHNEVLKYLKKFEDKANDKSSEEFAEYFYFDCAAIKEQVVGIASDKLTIDSPDIVHPNSLMLDRIGRTDGKLGNYVEAFGYMGEAVGCDKNIAQEYRNRLIVLQGLNKPINIHSNSLCYQND